MPLLLFNVESVVVLLPLFKLLSSHFIFLIKSRFTLTLSRKCGHSMFASVFYFQRVFALILSQQLSVQLIFTMIYFMKRANDKIRFQYHL